MKYTITTSEVVRRTVVRELVIPNSRLKALIMTGVMEDDFITYLIDKSMTDGTIISSVDDETDYDNYEIEEEDDAAA